MLGEDVGEQRATSASNLTPAKETEASAKNVREKICRQPPPASPLLARPSPLLQTYLDLHHIYAWQNGTPGNLIRVAKQPAPPRQTATITKRIPAVLDSWDHAAGRPPLAWSPPQPRALLGGCLWSGRGGADADAEAEAEAGERQLFWRVGGAGLRARHVHLSFRGRRLSPTARSSIRRFNPRLAVPGYLNDFLTGRP